MNNPINPEDARAAAEQSNRLFGQWMPERWLNLFIDSYNDIVSSRWGLADTISAADLKEKIAISLWHRFAPENHEEWTEETHAAEYRDAADAILFLARCADRSAKLSTALPQGVWRTDLENAPSEAYEFFLVRPQGTHPGRGGAFHPTIVQRIDGKFYTSDNELDPIYFGQDEPDDSPLKTTLEWKPLPADWLAASSVTRPQRGSGEPK